jgi:hypothetical protein
VISAAGIRALYEHRSTAARPSGPGNETGRAGTPAQLEGKENQMANPNEERDREAFDKLIILLEDTCEQVATILGDDARSSAANSRRTIDRPYQVYEVLCDLVDETRVGRSRMNSR